MKWSLRIARLAGIDLRVHLTFFILLAWVAWASFVAEGTVDAALQGIAFVLLLFAIIVLHELGHALTARRYGVATRDITLLPIGGVARLERMPDEPKHELLVALAGPAVNVVLAVVLAGLAVVLAVDLDPAASQQHLLAELVWINVALAVFNLLPAFPMDGGRALRALLAMRMPSMRATEIAAGLGQAMAVLLGIVGLFGNPVLLVIAAFVWLGARGEATSAQLEGALAGIPLGWAAARDVHTLMPDDRIEVAIEYARQGFQHDFPVLDGSGRVIGLLTHHGLLSTLAERGRAGMVADAMERDVALAHPSELLDRVLPRLEAAPGRCLLVVDDAHVFLGMVTVATVGELVAIARALERRRSSSVPTHPRMHDMRTPSRA